MKRILATFLLALLPLTASAQQSIQSGITDQYVYFVAVDATDYVSRETGLSSFTVYRSRNGSAAAAMTTPTINETDATNMPGVYELLLDEDMTIGTGNVTESMTFHITHAGMAPVTVAVELFDALTRTDLNGGDYALDTDANGRVRIVDGTGVGEIDTASGGVNLANDAITAAKIAADAIGASEIAADAIGASEIATDAIGAAEIAAAAITNAEFTATGTGLTAIPWNASWDAEVQSEVEDALQATTAIGTDVAAELATAGLDHLVNAAVTGSDVVNNSIIAKLVSSSATADWDDFVNTTDSLQATRDHIGDGTNLTEAGGDGDHLTEAGGTGDHLTAINVAIPNSIYVDPTGGNDANSGASPNLAKETISSAVSAASAGDVIRLMSGTHAVSGETTLPNNVSIVGAGMRGTIVTGDPGGGSASLFITGQNNTFADMTITATTQGACIETPSSAAAAKVNIERCNLIGDDDCVVLNPTSSGRINMTITDSIVDCSNWDGIANVAADASLVCRDTLFVGSYFAIIATVTTQDFHVSLQDCIFSLSNTTGDQSPLKLIVSGASAGTIYAEASDTTVWLNSAGAKHAILDSGTGSGTCEFVDLGGNNFDVDNMTLSNSAATSRLYPEYTWDIATSGNTDSGTFGEQLATDLDAVLVDTAEIGAAGAGLTAVPWNASWDAEVESEANDALVAIHLDHLLSADYDPASKPGTATALLNELVEDDGGVSRYTANALEQASGGLTAEQVNAEVDTALSDIRLDELLSIALASQPTTGSLWGDLTEDNGGTQRFTTAALANGAASTTETRDLEPVQHTWQLVRTGTGSLVSENALYARPDDVRRVSWNCDIRSILPTGAVLATMSTPTADSGITVTKLGIDNDEAKVEVTVDSGTAAGTYNVSCTVTNNLGGGPVTIYGQVVVQAAP